MALPLILGFIAKTAARYGGGKAIQMAVKKFGKKAVQKATNKMTYVGKNVAKKIVKKKVKPKAKSVNPYTLADYKQGIKYTAKSFKRKS